MLIVSRVCAEFHDDEGNILFTVQPNMRGQMTEAPDAIRNTLLFQLLVNEGSLKAVEDVADRKRLENEPMQGVDAEGKSKTDAAIAKAAGKTAKSAKSSKGSAASEATAPAEPAEGIQLTMEPLAETRAGDK